jgi:hypothetical protein
MRDSPVDLDEATSLLFVVTEIRSCLCLTGRCQGHRPQRCIATCNVQSATCRALCTGGVALQTSTVVEAVKQQEFFCLSGPVGRAGD